MVENLNNNNIMPDICKDYNVKGYCLKGRECPAKHGNDLIELNVADYEALVGAARKAIQVCKLEQNELKRKQTDLLMNLVSQQRALIEKIELCSDEGEKLRLKTALNEMSQKTKDWIEAQTSHQSQAFNTKSSSSPLPSTSTTSTSQTTGSLSMCHPKD